MIASSLAWSVELVRNRKRMYFSIEFVFGYRVLTSFHDSKNGNESKSVHALCFNHDFTNLSVGVGRRIFLFQVSDGELIRQLKGHKDQIYSISYSHDGEILASAGSDKCTILWTKEGKGILKFVHDTSVQVVAFHPIRTLLVSCSSNDYGFWSPDNQSVKKYRVDSKILCVAWRSDGKFLAIGFLSGDINVVCERGVIHRSITRSAPVWALTWGYFSCDGIRDEMLIAGSWDAKISFYDKEGSFLREQETNGYSTSLSMYSRSEDLFLVSTTGDGLYIINDRGKVVSNLAMECDWAWCARGIGSDGQSIVAYVGNDEILAMLNLSHEYVVCERDGIIAHTQSGTRIVVHDERNKSSETVECETCILSFAINRSILAILLKDNITLFSLKSCHHSATLTFKQMYSIEMDSSLCGAFHVVGNQVLAACKNRLSLYCTNGNKIRDWTLPSKITCLCAASQALEDCNILIGCVCGHVMSIDIDNTLAIEILKLQLGIKSIVASNFGQFLGIIDRANHLQVYNQSDSMFTQQKKGLAASIRFHREVESLYCYRSNGNLVIRDGNTEAAVSAFDGAKVITFDGSKITSLYKGEILFISVNFDDIVKGKIQLSAFESALAISQLGTSDPVWRDLAYQSLIGLNLDVAIRAYTHLEEGGKVAMLERLKIEIEDINGKLDKDQIVHLIKAEMDILEGNYKNAGETFISIGYTDRAIGSFVEGGMFNEAIKLASQSVEQTKFVLEKEAEWEEERGNFLRAADLYMESEAFVRSIDAASRIEGDEGVSKICHIANSLPLSERGALNRCCDYLAHKPQAEEQLRMLLVKMEDYSRLMALYVKTRSWLEVSKLREEHNDKLDKRLLLPYTQWLAANGNLVEALDINREAGCNSRNTLLLTFLIKDAIAQESYRQVSNLYWTASKERSWIGSKEVSFHVATTLNFCPPQH